MIRFIVDGYLVDLCNMAENFRHSVLRIVIAQLSQAVGFDSIQSSSLEILTNVLERYLLHVGRTIHDYSEQRLDTAPNLDDVWFAFRQLGISLPDIIDYTKQMESVKFPHNVAQFPAPKNSNMGFPLSLNSEILDRDEHIPLHMPSTILTNLKTEEKDTEPENLLTKKDFVIAKENPENFSSDEDIYSAGDNSSDEYVSDDSLSYNPTKSRRLIKPEDIPMVEGTAPSSLMSVPSVSELEDARSFSATPRRASVDKYHEIDHSIVKEKNPFNSKVPGNTPSASYSNVPWIKQDKPTLSKQQPVEPSSRSSDSNFKPSDPSWLSDKKKPTDVYDPGWLQEDDSSLVHLNKPPTPDVPGSNASAEKKSRFSRDKQSTPDTKLNKPFKKHGSSSKYSKHKVSQSPNPSSHKHSSKPGIEKKLAHQKKYKTSPVMKKPGDDEQIKAQIEAAERLLQNAPVPPQMPMQSSSTSPYISTNPKQQEKKSAHSIAKAAHSSTVDYGEKLSKKTDIPHTKPQEISISTKHEKLKSKIHDDKQERMTFASSKSMNDAIDAVISRATEESVRQDKEAEEAELMKFSHLVEDSSSSDSESDVSLKAEQMLQLQERGLQETHPSTLDSSSLSSFSLDDSPSPLMDSASNDSIKISHKKPDTPEDKGKPKAEKEKKHKKKSKHKDSKPLQPSSPKVHVKSKKNKPKQQPSFVTTETISPAPMKVKVKLKPLQPKEPKLFDVCDDKDRIKITHPSKPPKEEKHKSKDKSSKSKDHKSSTPKVITDIKRDKSEKEHSVGKIILKKSKSGDAKVIKSKSKEHARSPSPITNRSSLPLPKLSAAVPVTNVTVTAKEKEKKKVKKEKKKKKDREKDRNVDKEKHHEKTKESKEKTSHQKESKSSGWESRSSSRRESFESDVSCPVVPKLTLKMGGNEKEFVIRPSGSSSKTGSKKRPHSSGSDLAKPTKERKISVECVKTVSESFAAAVERKVVTQTISVGPGPVGVYEDDEGNKVSDMPILAYLLLLYY